MPTSMTAPQTTPIERAMYSADDDRLIGDADDNVINGDAGDNLINGAGGRDVISGGDGDDFINGGAGADEVTGGSGADLFYCYGDPRYSEDHSGDVILDYDPDENDVLVYGQRIGWFHDLTVSYDHITDPDGTRYGDADIEEARIEWRGRTIWVLADGAALDNILLRPQSDRTSFLVDAKTRTARMEGTEGDDNLAADSYFGFGHTVMGFGGNDRIEGSRYYDVLLGGMGDDLFEGDHLGGDTIDGGAGFDTLDVRHTGSYQSRSAEVDLSAGFYRVSYPSGTVTGVEAVIGTSGADILIGDANGNALSGGGGKDLLIGGAGADELGGGTNRDTVDYSASDAAVTIDLAAGTGAGGDAEGDRLTGIEIVIGSAGDDHLIGDDRDNTLEGREGADRLDGGAGRDVARYAASYEGVTIDLAAGIVSGGTATGDTLTDMEGVVGTAFDDVLTGDAADNLFSGGDGRDILSGGDGDDFLNGAAGLDELTGGSGADMFYNRGLASHTGDSGADVVLDYDPLENDILAYGQSGRTRFFSVTYEHALNADGDRYGDPDIAEAHVRFANGARSDGTHWILADGAALDSILIRPAADHTDIVVDLLSLGIIDGTEGNDTLNGDQYGAYADRIDGRGGDDLIDGGAMQDTLVGGAGDDIFTGDVLEDIIDGGAGLDTIDFSDATRGPVTVDLSEGRMADLYGRGGGSMTGIEAVIGTSRDDTLIGDANDNALSGGGGKDLLIGGAGVDALDGGTNRDTVDYSASDEAVTVDLAAGTGAGGDAEGDSLADIEIVIGTAGDDHLIGDDRDNTLEGGEGADRLDGGAGTDVASYVDSPAALTVDLAEGTVFGGNADGDILSAMEGAVGSRFDDLLTGDAADNLFNGAGGSDLIAGGDGNDFLNGGMGYDFLTGGAGADLFYNYGAGSRYADPFGHDVVFDYDPSENDVLVYGQSGSRWGFSTRNAHATDENGDRYGDDGIEETYVTAYGSTVWVLVDGAALDTILLRPDADRSSLMVEI